MNANKRVYTRFLLLYCLYIRMTAIVDRCKIPHTLRKSVQLCKSSKFTSCKT
nr:MAG TPA: hypothetical protein [Caudoviricetes sp.]